GRAGGGGRGRTGREARGPRVQVGLPPHRLDHGGGRRGDRTDAGSPDGTHVRGGRHHRRWQLQLEGVDQTRRTTEREGHHLPGLRDLGRDLGSGQRVLPDGRRGPRCLRPDRTDLQGAGSRGWLRLRRAVRGRPLREDGSQRDRVRAARRLRRGLRDPPGLRLRGGPSHHRRHLALRQRGAIVALGAPRGRLRKRPTAGHRAWVRRGLRRGPVDGAGGHRRERSRAGHRAGALLAGRLPAGGVLRGEGHRRTPPGVRRSRGEARRGALMAIKPGAPQAVVIFGASGDLTRRKLLPAFYHLFVEGLLPEGFAIVGYARTEQTDDEFQERARQAVQEFGRTDPAGEEWEESKKGLSYIPGEFDSEMAMEELREHLERIDKAMGTNGGRFYYCATPAAAYPLIVTRLAESDLHTGARIVIEKPFGHDLESAKELN